MTDPSEFEFPVPPHFAEMHAMAHQRFKRQDWEEPPTNWLPGLVPVEHVAGRSQDAVVTLSPIRAYPSGFSIDLCSVVREPDPQLDHMMFGGMHGAGGAGAGGTLPDSLLRVALTYADGSTTSTLSMFAPPAPPAAPPSDPSQGPAVPAAPTMMMSSGNGGLGTYSMHYWCWPLPPEGAIQVICEWPAFGIEREVTQLDGSLIREAAQRAERLWDDPPEPPSGMWGTGGVGVNVS